MNAKEARITALSVTDGEMKRQYNDIKNYIERDAKEGKFQTYYYETLLAAVFNKLTIKNVSGIGLILE